MSAQLNTHDGTDRAGLAAAVFAQEAIFGNDWPQFGGAPTVVVAFADGVYVMGASVEEVVCWYQCHFIARSGEHRLCKPADLLPGGGGLTLGTMALNLPDRLAGVMQSRIEDWEIASPVPLVPFVLCTERTVPACFVVADPTQPLGMPTAWAMVMDDASREAYVWETLNAWIQNGGRPMRVPVAQVAALIQDLTGARRVSQVQETVDLTDILVRASLSRHPASVHAPMPQVDIDVEGAPIPTIVTFRERDMLDRTVEWMAGQGWLSHVGAAEFRCGPGPNPTVHEAAAANDLSGASAPERVRAEIQSRADASSAVNPGPTGTVAAAQFAEARQMLAKACALIAKLAKDSKAISVADYRLLTRLREASSESIKVWRMGDGTCVACASPLEAQSHFATFLGLAQPYGDVRQVSLTAQLQRPGQPIDPQAKTYAQVINEHIAKGGQFPLIVN